MGSQDWEGGITWVPQFIPKERTDVNLRYWKWHRLTLLQVRKHRGEKRMNNEGDCLWKGINLPYYYHHVPSVSPKVHVGMPIEKTATTQPPVLPLGLLCPSEVSNAACLLLGAGIKVYNSFPLLIRIFSSGNTTYFSQPVNSWRLVTSGWQCHIQEVQLPVTLTWQGTCLPMSESLKASATPFREWRESLLLEWFQWGLRGIYLCELELYE